MVAQDDLRQLVQSTRRISRALDIESRRIDREIGLTLPQLIVLQCLQDLGDANSRSISRAAGMSPPSVVGILDKLEAKGVIHRYRSTIDRRAVHTALTEKGAGLLAGAPQPLGENFAQRFRALPAARRCAILEALMQVADLADETLAADHVENGHGADEMIG